MKIPTCCFVGLLIAFASVQPVPVAAQANTQSVRERLVGTWLLVSTEEHLKDGTTRPYKDVGTNGRGYLVYTADGHMCADLMNADRPKWKDEAKPTDAEKINAIEGFAGYCGRYEVDQENRVVYHYPEVAWTPNYVGTKQKRPYSFEKDLLVFAGKQGANPEVESWRIVWRKVK